MLRTGNANATVLWQGSQDEAVSTLHAMMQRAELPYHLPQTSLAVLHQLVLLATTGQRPPNTMYPTPVARHAI